MTTHNPFNRLAATVTLHLFLAMLVLVPWSARARIDFGGPDPLQPDGVEVSELTIDLHERIDRMYGDPRIGWGGRFVLDIDMDDTGFDITLSDRANDGTTCEITMVSDGSDFVLEYSPDCDPPRLFDVIDAVFPGMVDVDGLHAWWEANGGNGDGDDQQDTEDTYGFDDDMFREDGGGDCSFGNCMMNAVYVAAASIAIACVNVPAGFVAMFIGGIGVGLVCHDSMNDPGCTDDLVEELMYLLDETLGWHYIDVQIDLDAFLQYIEQVLAQVLQTETYVTELGFVNVTTTTGAEDFMTADLLVHVVESVEV